MVLEKDGPLCPYCGEFETSFVEERSVDSVYECSSCRRTFSAPKR